MNNQCAVLKNIGTLYQCLPDGKQRDVHPIDRAALAWSGGVISWVGKEVDLPAEYKNSTAINAGGGIVLPGLIDCHTHLAFGGFRAHEFEQRILGKTYLEIAQAGGGILSTVEKTRAISPEELVKRGLEFLKAMQKFGVTTVECKSGYGLTLPDELKLLRVYRELSGLQPLTVIPTLLAAHTIPPEFKERRGDYIDLICNEIIPQVAKEKLAAFCDVFAEKSAFSIPETERILSVGLKHGLKPKLHADQLSCQGGAELAARVKAVSADHLECINASGMEAMAKAQVIAVMLPVASLYTFERALNARTLLDAGVRVALATDFNPGSAPSYHLPFAMMLGCTLNRLTPREVLKAVTCNAAAALGLSKTHGSLSVGMAADIAVIDSESIEQLLYLFGENRCSMTIKAGVVLS